MAALAEFERDLLHELVRSGIAAARARGVHFGRRPGQRIKADRVAPGFWRWWPPGTPIGAAKWFLVDGDYSEASAP